MRSPAEVPHPGPGELAGDRVSDADLAAVVDVLKKKVEELEHRVAREGVGRSALGMCGNDVRVDCQCGGNLALLDALTGTLRLGYDKLYAYLPAEARIAVTCKRCKCVTVVEHGQAIAYVDPLDIARGWRAGQPLPDGMQALTR